MSLALLGAGYPNPGKWPVKAGKYNGRAIETQQRRLSAWLTRHAAQPEKFKGGQPQGHIAIVTKDRWGKYLRCGNEIDATATSCYWSSREVWFWPLK